MKLTIGMALGAIVAGLAAFQLAAPVSVATPFLNAATLACGAALAYLHAQGVDGSAPPVSPPSS